MNTEEKWNALTDADREALLNKHRSTNTEWDDWWESVYTQFQEDMAEIGIRAERMYFSGFWSQGDGACFEGFVENWSKFLTAAGYPELIEFKESFGDLNLGWEHDGHYYHEHCIRYTPQLDVHNPFDEKEEALRHAAWKTINGPFGPFFSLGEEFEDFIREQMCDLYKRLEEEYDDLTSDEAVLSYILDNCEEEIDKLLESNKFLAVC